MIDACAIAAVRANLEQARGDSAITLEQQFSEIASYVALVIEAGAVFVVSFGAVQAIIGVVRAIFSLHAFRRCRVSSIRAAQVATSG